MDDTFRISQLLFTNPPCNLGITIGFLLIVSNIPLTVTAVYTASTLDGVLASIDVEEINPREIPVSAIRGAGLEKATEPAIG